MSRINLVDLANLENESTAIGAVNVNNEILEEIMDKALFRTGESPNHMQAQLDMNTNRIINLPAAIEGSSDPVRASDLNSLIPDFALAQLDIDAAEQAKVDAQNAAAQAINAAASVNVGTIAVQNANAVNISGGTIAGTTLSNVSVSAPVASTDISTKKYSDQASGANNVRSAVRLATTATLSNSPVYTAGTGTTLATLAATTNGTLVIDVVTAVIGDRVLVKDQATSLHNDVYTVTSAGSAGSTYLLTRSPELDPDIKGETFYVSEGSVNTGSIFVRVNTTPNYYLDTAPYLVSFSPAFVSQAQHNSLVTSVASNAANISSNTSNISSNASAISVLATKTANIFYVSCDITGTIDATSAIQSKVDAAVSAGGGRVILPAGIILVNGTVSNPGVLVNGSVTIEGQGWEDYKGYFLQYGLSGIKGTYIKQTTTSYSCFQFKADSDGSVIKNVAFIQTHAADVVGWTPTNYPPCISTPDDNGGSLLIDHCMFWGVNKGIQCGAYASGMGRMKISNCYGACFTWCVHVFYSGDVFNMSDCHWYSGFLAGNPNIMAYIQANGTVCLSYKNDNPHFVNNFNYGYYYGYRFEEVNYRGADIGNTVQINMVNCEADSTVVGIYIDAPTSGSETTGCITNFRTQSDWNGATGIASSSGLFVKTKSWLDLVNFRCGNSQANAIRVEGSGSDISITNASLEDWNREGTGWPALEVVDAGSKVTVSGRFRTTGGGGAAVTFGNVYGSIPWTTYTPTLTYGSGTPGTITATGRYRVREDGTTVDVQIEVINTTNGSAGTYIKASTPHTINKSTVINGFQTGASYTVSGTAGVGDTGLFIFKYDGSYPGASGQDLVLRGVYEKA